MKYSTQRAFEKHLADASPQHFSLIYTVLTKDDFIRKTSTDLLVKYLMPKEGSRSLSCRTIDGSRTELQPLLQELNTRGLFADKRVIVIEQADQLSKQICEKLESYLSRPSKDCYLVFTAGALNHSTRFYKALEKEGVILEIAEEKPWEKEKTVQEWLVGQAHRLGKNMEHQTAQLLVKQIGSDYAILNQELEKVACFIGERKIISENDVRTICITQSTDNAWQLGEAIFRLDGGGALKIVKGLLSSDASVFFGLIRQLRSQFQTAFQICSILANGGDQAEISRQFPYLRGQILERQLQASQKYGMARFKKGMILIDETELKAKNSSIDVALLADLLIIKLVGHQ